MNLTKLSTIALLLFVGWLEAGAIGYVYTGVGRNGRDLMELTRVHGTVTIQDRVAVTRVDQIFTNHSDQQVEGIYEFALPSGAIITDLVLWIGDKRIQGIIMENEEARRIYDDIVGRRIDPALIERIGEDRFRLSIFPFPAEGSRRVELEYVQVLEAWRGQMDYRFPLAPETDQPVLMETFVLEVAVRGQHPFAVGASFERETQIDQTDEYSADVFFGDEDVAPTDDFVLTMVETAPDRRPTVLSFAPLAGDEFGYYALWLPPLRELSTSAPMPRGITFVIDISSSMRGPEMTAVQEALAAAIGALEADDFFNVIVFSTGVQAWMDQPVAATAENRVAASDFIRSQGASGMTNFEQALRLSLRQAMPDRRLHHIVFMTDGEPTVGEENLLRLSELVDELAGDKIRVFTIGVGSSVNRGFLRGLAEQHRGAWSFLDREEDIERRLRDLFEEFSRPIFLAGDLNFEGVDILDVFPREMDILAQGQELFQVGRYRVGGPFTLTLEGQVQDQALDLAYPLEFTDADVSQPLIPRLWAHQKVQALENQIAHFGQQRELLDDILDLGLTYRLVTRRTSLFAPDEEVVINPEPEQEEDLGMMATAVEEEALGTTSWLGKQFYLQGDTWIDLDFHPGLPVLVYADEPEPPAQLAGFAQLNQSMIVVLGNWAYEFRVNGLPSQLVLRQNAPNPFNASTVIPFALPAGLEGADLRLGIYNLAGQLIRTWRPPTARAGTNQVHWDGTDSQGRAAASGVYIYRLELEGGPLWSRRMLLLR